MHLLGDLADASTEATQAISSYIQYLEEEVAPKARASFRLGQEHVRAQAGARRGHLDRRRPPAQHRAARVPGDAGRVPVARGQAQRRRSHRGVAPGEGRASGAGRALSGGAAAARRAEHVHRSQRHHHPSRRRAGDRRADARVLSLVVREHVGARSVRAEGRPAPTTT